MHELKSNPSFHTRLLHARFDNTIHRVDQVIAGDGKTISISHVRYTTLLSSSHSLMLNHIYHIHATSNNLINVSKLYRDNRTLVKFHPNYFLVKD